MTPQRVQLRRTKDWRKPVGVVVVSRPTRWGNPFKGENGAATMTRQLLVDEFRQWLLMPTRTDPRTGVQEFNGCPHFLGVPYDGRPTVDEIREQLADRDLGCWCDMSQPCHADVLLELANSVGAS